MDLPLNRTQLIEIVENSAQLMADTFGLPLSFAGKDGRTDAAGAVTEIDRAVQTKLMEALPGDFMGEEEGQRVTGSDLIWMLIRWMEPEPSFEGLLHPRALSR
jgi:fructose-1,6-bisphosphatase/inositol monophosphatase family enzyme